jgi:uracil-DNA glycosylase
MTNIIDWIDVIADESIKDYYKKLQEFLDLEYSTYTIYPPRYLIFNAFYQCPLNELKVVILGLDPYINPDQAQGLCFSVFNNIKTPPSLRNLLKELHNDLNIIHKNDLTGWARQGVLMLNTILTVRQGQTLSHANMGWEIFTDNILKYINENCKEIIFLLLGNHAQKKKILIDINKHYIIEASHPCGMSCYKTDKPFMGSKCFSKVNNILTNLNKNCINWDV